MKRRINDTLLELIVGIVVCGALIQIVAVVVAGFSAEFAVGLWIGIAAAVGLAAHMYRSIDRALDMQPDDAEKYMRKAYLIRTVMILAVAGVVTYVQLGYVMATFGGVLCLKFGAFLQPLVHRLISGKNQNPGDTGDTYGSEGQEDAGQILETPEQTDEELPFRSSEHEEKEQELESPQKMNEEPFPGASGQEDAEQASEK